MDAVLAALVGHGLDDKRAVGDDWAHKLLEKNLGKGDPIGTMRVLGSGKWPSEIERFLQGGYEAEQDEIAALIDTSLVNHAQRFFETYGLQISAGLLLCSLPEAYAAARGVQVLYLTSELVSNPGRRIRETLQFLIDMLAAPGHREALGPTTLHAGGPGARSARQLRLFHAAVREIITTEMADRWETRKELFESQSNVPLGEPVNQEDLLGTLFTFTVTIHETLEKMGVPVTEKDVRAWYHVWDVIGRHMGIGVDSALGTGASHVGRPGKDPIFGSSLTADYSTSMMKIIRLRQRAESHEGKILINALLRDIEAPLPRAAKPAPALLMRFLDPEVADLLGLRRGRWGPYWIQRVLRHRWVAKTVSTGLAMRPVGLPTGEASGFIARQAMQSFVRQGRLVVPSGTAPRVGADQFAIPERLCRTWGITEMEAGAVEALRFPI